MEYIDPYTVLVICQNMTRFCCLVQINQELDNNLRKCKEEFKQFEREDVKYREDLKHVKQKIKKLKDKLEKVGEKHYSL